jgi:hypothetical protein
MNGESHRPRGMARGHVPLAEAMPGLSRYTTQGLCGVVRVGDKWHVFGEGTLDTTEIPSQIDAINELARRVAR